MFLRFSISAPTLVRRLGANGCRCDDRLDIVPPVQGPNQRKIRKHM